MSVDICDVIYLGFRPHWNMSLKNCAEKMSKFLIYDYNLPEFKWLAKSQVKANRSINLEWMQANKTMAMVILHYDVHA